MKLDAREAKRLIEEWDMESGKIRRLASDRIVTYTPGELQVLSVVNEESPTNEKRNKCSI